MALPAESRPFLSAAMIVRDEEARLERCLASLVDLVDEIVVVDTGSVDATTAVAAAFGATIGHFPWVDDFGAARNASLDLVTGDWVLMIDADEYVAPIDRSAVVDALEGQPSALGVNLLWRSGPGLTPMRELRLWRHRPDVRFRGRIHEHVVEDLFGLIAAGEGVLGTLDLLIEHDGYVGDMTAKHRRNLPLLEAEITHGTDRPYLHQCLGDCLMALGRPEEALAAWRSGARLAVDGGFGRPQDLGCHHALIMHGIANDLDVADVMADAWTRFDYGLVAWSRVCWGQSVGDDDAVIEAADRLLAGPQPQDAAFSLDPAIFDRWAHVARARALLRSGRGREARADLDRAIALAPEVLEYRVLRSLAQAGDDRVTCA